MKTDASDKQEQEANHMARVRSSRWLGNFFDLGAVSRAAEVSLLAALALPVLGLIILIAGTIMDREDIARWSIAPVAIATICFVIMGMLEKRAREAEDQNQEEENRDPKC